jgi:16S rRNA processing protein RimM
VIALGRLVAPYGVGGWLHLHPFGDDPMAWSGIAEWWLGSDAEGSQWTKYCLAALRQHGDGWVVKFDGVDDRSGAEALVGKYFAAPRENLPKTADNEFYWADLIGLVVVNGQAEALGAIESLIETGANSVLVVRDGERKRLLPFVAQVVKSVDVAAGRVVVDWGADW